MALRRRYRDHPVDGDWITFKGGGKRTYRRRKTETDYAIDESHRKLTEWGKELVRKEILEGFYAAKKTLPRDLAERHSGFEDWITWAREQIKLDRVAAKRKLFRVIQGSKIDIGQR